MNFWLVAQSSYDSKAWFEDKPDHMLFHWPYSREYLYWAAMVIVRGAIFIKIWSIDMDTILSIDQF